METGVGRATYRDGSRPVSRDGRVTMQQVDFAREAYRSDGRGTML